MCKKVFHCTCVDIKRSETGIIMKRNVKWFCNECECLLFNGNSFVEMVRSQSDILLEMKNQIKVMSENIRSLQGEISQLKSKEGANSKVISLRRDKIQRPEKQGKETPVPKNITVKDVQCALNQVTEEEQKTYAQIVNKQEDDFKLVTRRKWRKYPETIGTGAGSDKLTGIVRKAWLYIGRATKSATTDSVQGYLKEAFPDIVFSVENLHSKGLFSSFRVSCNFEHLVEINKPELWPSGIVLRQFKFFRQGRNSGNQDIVQSV